MVQRCHWASSDIMIDYHDCEWGVPQHDDQKLFELLMLEGAQAGLSWETILKKRENYREAFDKFDVEKVAAYTDERLAEILQDPGIVRNRLKVRAFQSNAVKFIELQQLFGSFDAYLWDYVEGKPFQHSRGPTDEAPSNTELSDRLSASLKRRGFKFVGSTICYAFLQSAGLVNDHQVSCFRLQELRDFAGASGLNE